MEITLKIANKIRANERFDVYVVVPMWPEGVPTGIATQRILFWQNKTMQMMYETIYKALEEVGLENTYVPKNYLNFFCLENCEASDGTELSFEGSPIASNTPHAEHTGFLEDIFTVPKSLECVRRVRSLGESNLRQFAVEDVSEMRGHLLKYSVEVYPRGKVKPIPGYKSFPDVGGTIVDCDHYINNSKALREGMYFMMDPLLGEKTESIKLGMWDGLYDAFHSIDQHICTSPPSSSAELETIEIEPPCKRDASQQSSLHKLNVSVHSANITVVDIGKSIAAYFEHETSITREAKSPFKTQLSCWKKLCDCELWLTEEFPVNDFDSLGYEEFL
ncbi:hypothetical protein GIB67_010013 [Kingdonia uniflora]|uniref:Phospholipase D C-terminal domain-containing protein n=1 Tax=Kingdonia uniflora TaxID=39325 RepID=A0A7J7KV72_9MAGN|nr:hypothetical protein GIB67_010013 [Kingdonia uniflora]